MPPDDESLPWPDRKAGVLLHPTSLPGPFGAGDLGDDARLFVDLLHEAGQSVWQIMPLGPPGPGNSPYAARSAFAGNPLLISLAELQTAGWLTPDDLLDCPVADHDQIPFDALAGWRDHALRRAFARFSTSDAVPPTFLEAHATWLPDFALFTALRQRYGTSWTEWPAPLVHREPADLVAARNELADEIAYQSFLQWLFFEQWARLRAYAHDRGVQVLGDIPIFPDFDSADVWAHQEIFDLDSAGRPNVVAGVPPDAFSESGQRWGNPLYRWDALRARSYDWWVDRLRATFELVDLVRIDHFRGFQAAWHIPASSETAREGEWVTGPGAAVFAAARAVLGELPIVVEDLGIITRDVRRLRDELGYPGMKVLQFAFGDDARNPYLPHNFSENSVVYTGTHDNDTTLGWFRSLPDWQRDRLLHYLARDGSDIVNDLIRVAYGSVARLAIVPMQDILGLDSSGRMNTPGTATGNWSWRFDWGQVDPGRIRWLHDTALLYGRLRPPDA